MSRVAVICRTACLMAVVTGAALSTGCQSAPLACFRHETAAKARPVPHARFQAGAQPPRDVSLPAADYPVSSFLFSVGVLEYDDNRNVREVLPPELPLPDCLVRLTRPAGNKLMTLTFPLASGVNGVLSRLPIVDGDVITLIHMNDTSLKPLGIDDAKRHIGKPYVYVSRQTGQSVPRAINAQEKVLRHVLTQLGGKPPLELGEVIVLERTLSAGHSETLLLPLSNSDVLQTTTLDIRIQAGPVSPALERLNLANQLTLGVILPGAPTTIPVLPRFRSVYNQATVQNALINPNDVISVSFPQEVPAVLAMFLTPIANNIDLLADRSRRVADRPLIRRTTAAAELIVDPVVGPTLGLIGVSWEDVKRGRLTLPGAQADEADDPTCKQKLKLHGHKE